MLKKQNQQGIGIVGLIIFLALVFAVLNLYAYFNPNFSLSKYSPVNYLKNQRDEQRRKDLESLQVAVQKYYEEHGNKYPGSPGGCGRIVAVLHSQVLDSLTPYFPPNDFPQDPSFQGTNKDYFYARTETGYVLMASLETAPEIPEEEKSSYNFKSCYDWPGDDVYNYRLDNSDE
jgi:hypothetical protein